MSFFKGSFSWFFQETAVPAWHAVASGSKPPLPRTFTAWQGRLWESCPPTEIMMAGNELMTRMAVISGQEQFADCRRVTPLRCRGGDTWRAAGSGEINAGNEKSMLKAIPGETNASLHRLRASAKHFMAWQTSRACIVRRRKERNYEIF